MTPPNYIFTPPLNDPRLRGAKPQEYNKRHESGMIIETHVSVPLRTGSHAFSDVYRPEDESTQVPLLIAWTPYGKHDPAPLHKIYPNSGTQRSWCSEYTCFEGPDPLYWSKHGYAVAMVDVPGTWLGDGRAIFSSGAEEAENFYDAIEWFAAQKWCTGKVGLSGVSYLAVSQWHVAALRPPSLSCIVPDEGWTDFYREVMCHGGIPDTSFFPYIAERWGASINPIENLMEEFHQHPFFDELWESKKAQLDKIQVPALVIASFADQGLHTRGTLEGFKKISSQEKWLIVHRRKKWAFFYTPEVVEKQRAFYDKFLKGIKQSQVEEWPPVLVEVGDRFYDGKWRYEAEWPLRRQVLTSFFLDSQEGCLVDKQPHSCHSADYDALGGGPHSTRAVYTKTFTSDTEITGHISATLFMETTQGDDMDVFVAIYKLGSQGELVGQTFYAQFEDGPVCLGWLRASRRELDEQASVPEQPIHLHKRELKLAPGQVYELNIELWASSMVYHAGEKLCFIVQGTDIARKTNLNGFQHILTRHESRQVNTGTHKLWTGGAYPSQLLVPIIPNDE